MSETAAISDRVPDALRVANLSAKYNETRVLHGITCEMPARTVQAVLGPSGSGKTTFIKALNRTLELTPGAGLLSGSVYFDGEDLYATEADVRHIRRRIGIIHQRPVTFPMSILENVLFGARFHGTGNGQRAPEAAEEFLRMAGLWEEVKDRLGDSATRLSLGQQQRLCIARALANRPQVLLMDEPCSALDPHATQHIEDLVADLKARYTLVIVTHNFSQARRVADGIHFFFGGRLLESAPTRVALENPRHPLVKDFVTGKIG